METMDRFDVLIRCVAQYNKQYCVYAKEYYLTNKQNESKILFDKMHKKNYCKFN